MSTDQASQPEPRAAVLLGSFSGVAYLPHLLISSIP